VSPVKRKRYFKASDDLHNVIEWALQQAGAALFPS